MAKNASGAVLRFALNDLERDFVRYYLALRDPAESWKRANPKVAEEQNAEQHKFEGKQLLKLKHVSDYLDHLENTTDIEQANDIYNYHMQFGDNATQSLKAAKEVIEKDTSDNARDGIERWYQVMSEVGAEVVIHPTATERPFSFKDLLGGKAHMRLPFPPSSNS